MKPFRSGLRTLASAAALAAVLHISPDTAAGPPDGVRIDRPVIDGDQVRFRWEGAGDVEIAPTPSGPWTRIRPAGGRVSEAVHPALKEGNLFFRVVEQGVAGTPLPIVEGDPGNPFRILRATVRRAPGPSGDALLEAELVAGQNPPASFPVLQDDRVVILRDDGRLGDATAGDGVFTAPIFFDIEDLRAANEFVRSLPPESRALGGFEGRRLARGVLPTLFDVEGFEAGRPVAVHPSPLFGRGIVPDGFLPGRTAVQAALPPVFREVCVTNILSVTNLPAPVAVPASATVDGGPDTTTVVVPGMPTNITLVTNIVCSPVLVDPGATNVVEVPVDDVLRRPSFAEKSLLVTDLSVVEDPARTFDPCTGKGTRMGAWTFGRLMTDLCNPAATGIDPSDFTRRWLRSWQADQTINFDRVAQRNAEILDQVIRGWENASGGPGRPLDLAIAPFRLLAIVNRVDLRQNPGYGGGTAGDPCNPSCVGGEGRFVFGLIADAFGRDAGGVPGGGYNGGGGTGSCGAAPFTVIFEYCVPRRTCSEIKDWGLRWFALSRMDFGPAFNAALQAITDEFAGAGADPSRRPNLSALSQLRANELLREPWEMREWRLFPTDSDAGWLREVTVKQTPAIAHNRTPTLVEFCAANAPAILGGSHQVPLEWRGAGRPSIPFLGGGAPMDTAAFFWDGPPPAGSSLPTDLRHAFSLNTCNGCHAGDTGTPFTHVFPREAGTESRLSDFLTGRNMPKLDPADGVTPRTFADLRRREDDLLRLVVEPCFLQVLQEPLRFEH